MPDSEYLKPTYYINSDHPSVVEYTRKIVAAETSPIAKAVALYYRVRDDFRYYPYHIDLRKPALRASAVIGQKQSYCVQKALVLAATCRAAGIPSRVQFFNVRNHLGTGELEKALKTDLIVFHGGTQIFLDGKWLKAVPAFDASLCRHLKVEPLEFDGHHDAVFQEYSELGGHRLFMEYVHDYGTFADFPFDLAMSELKKHYPSAFDSGVPVKDRIVFSQWEIEKEES